MEIHFYFYSQRDFKETKKLCFWKSELEELWIEWAADSYHDSLAVFMFMVIHLLSFWKLQHAFGMRSCSHKIPWYYNNRICDSCHISLTRSWSSRSSCNKESSVVYIFQHFHTHWEKQEYKSNALVIAALREGRGPQLYLKIIMWKEINSNGLTIKLDRKLHFTYYTRTYTNIVSSLAFAVSCFVKLKSRSYLMQWSKIFVVYPISEKFLNIPEIYIFIL